MTTITMTTIILTTAMEYVLCREGENKKMAFINRDVPDVRYLFI